MTKKSLLKLLSIGCMAGLLVCGASTPPAAATTYHTITVDCNIGEWHLDENIGAGGVGSQLYITWDATYLYVGVWSPVPDVYTTVYIDTAPGGTRTASTGGTHQIATAPRGYEYSYSDVGFLQYETTGGPTTWTWAVPPPGTQFCSGMGSSGVDVEFGIPWTDIDVPPGTRITILVQDRTAPDTVSEYWPTVPGNSNPPPSFTQGFVFAMPPATGVHPGILPPTAVSVQETATSGIPNWVLPALVALPAAGLAARLLIRRRRSHAQE